VLSGQWHLAEIGVQQDGEVVKEDGEVVEEVQQEKAGYQGTHLSSGEVS